MFRYYKWIAGLVVLLGFISLAAKTNQTGGERMLIVLAAPSVSDPYYKKHFKKIINFQVRYAKQIIGNDNVIVVADGETMPYLKDKLPADVLLTAELGDIWIRDYSPVHPARTVQFAYDRPKQKFVTKSFAAFQKKFGLKFKKHPLKVDGGNVVDNGRDAAVLTEKVFARNKSLKPDKVADTIAGLLQLDKLAVIPADDEHLGHSDGMVMFVARNKLIVNSYAGDKQFKNLIWSRLKSELPGVKLIPIEGNGYGEKYGPYASACGIYVNSVVTNRNIYVPTFGTAADGRALKVIRSNTAKKVIPVDAKDVCFLGGSVRCLSWQLTGTNATRLIKAAGN